MQAFQAVGAAANGDGGQSDGRSVECMMLLQVAGRGPRESRSTIANARRGMSWTKIVCCFLLSERINVAADRPGG
jgi:hypothetical protein